MAENISNIIVAAAAVIGAITATLLGGIAIWAFRDIRSRSRDILVQILAPVMVAVIPIAGLLIYFMLRPRETLQEAYVRALEEESLLSSIEHQEFCPTCGRRVDQDMQFCPSCHTKLRNACRSCGKAVHLSWDLCPYCGTGQTPELPRVSKPVSQRVGGSPAATQVAPPAERAWQPPLNAGQAKARIGGLLDKVGGAIDSVAAKAQRPPAPPTSAPTLPSRPAAPKLPRTSDDDLE